MRRGIVVYVEDKADLLLQFGCLYTSYKYINSNDTELVVFGPEEALKKIPSDCIKYKYDPLKVPPEFSNYPFINSLSCLLSDGGNDLNKYDFILRSDVDTFLTPTWNHFYPEEYTVGKGSYVFSDNVRNSIKKVSNRLGLNHCGLHNLGSTHYGNPELVRKVSKLAVSIAEYILVEEFKYTEGSWPEWYRGVTSMYSSEIALNHLIPNVKIAPEQLDYDSTSSSHIHLHPHIHCWHTDSMFSKFQFAQGNYDHLVRNQLNIELVNDYCLYMSLLSKKTSSNE